MRTSLESRQHRFSAKPLRGHLAGVAWAKRFGDNEHASVTTWTWRPATESLDVGPAESPVEMVLTEGKWEIPVKIR